MGSVLSRSGKASLAIEQATRALLAGDLPEAKQRLRVLILKQPNNAEALATLAQIAIDEQRADEATILLRRAAHADPSSDRKMRLVKHLHLNAGPTAALAEIEVLSASIRQRVDVRSFEAALLGMLGQHERQIELCRAITSECPEDAALWISLANALKTCGQTGEAVTAVRRALEVEPNNGEAYWTLANFKSVAFTERDIGAMRKALRHKLSDAEKAHFNFALGRAFEDRRDFARSFLHYSVGNDLQRAKVRPEQMRVTGFVDVSIATFGRALFDRHRGAVCTTRGPIFVVGLHRSGSTLIEQILASHPLIEGTGELPVMQQIWRKISETAARFGCSPFKYIERLDSHLLAQIGAEYLDSSRSYRRTDRPLFVDKLPANWLNVGLIRLALPNASIIDARRHPLACGLANFKQHYAAGVAFSYGLPSIGCFYRDYLRMMKHFDRVQPGAIHHLLNERLISDTEVEIRRLLEHVGVPFDAACLEFHRNQRPVRTPSAEQVRRPINSEGANAWRPYDPWLGPLKLALGAALNDWIPDTT